MPRGKVNAFDERIDHLHLLTPRGGLQHSAVIADADYYARRSNPAIEKTFYQLELIHRRLLVPHFPAGISLQRPGTR